MEIALRTLLIGLVTGSVYALSATGLVLTYRISGVLNLGYGALAMFSTFLHWTLTVQAGVPGWISALIVVLLVAPMMGVALQSWVFGRLRDQPAIIGLIASVGVWVLLQGIVIVLWGSETRSVPSLFPQRTIPFVGGARVGVDQIAVLGVAVVAASALAALLRFTRTGIALRAVVDDRTLAGLMTIPVSRMSQGAWAIGASLAALTGILLTPRLLLDPLVLPAFIIAFVLGSAMVGYVRSLPRAYAGGILLGVLQALAVQYGSSSRFGTTLGDAAPFLIILVFVLASPHSIRLAAQAGATGMRGALTRTGATASTQPWRFTGPALFAVLAVVPVITAGSVSWKLAVTSSMIFSIIFLSLVVLTGFSGQISFGQTAFMGIAAFTTAHLARGHVPVWVAFALGALAAVPAGMLIGLAALRVHGLYLALMSLAFAFMCHQVFFTDPSVSGLEGQVPMPRPEGFHGDNAFYFLVLALLAIFVVLARNVRGGRTGRVLSALRDSEVGTRALGINVPRHKIAVFALSAFMAGTGAILAAMSEGQVARLDFLPFFSLVYITLAVVGGIFDIGGAIVAGLLFGLYPQAFRNNDMMLNIQLIMFGLAATVVLARAPSGLYGQLRRASHATASRLRHPAQPIALEGGQE
ncbi:MAG: hypothetical protein NVSMB57_01010 [Actinomycetota bacterium]